MDNRAGATTDPLIDVAGRSEAPPRDVILMPVRTAHEERRATRPAPGSTDPVFIRDRHGLHRVDRIAIILLQADGNYVEVHTQDRRFVLRNSLREVAAQLGEDRFVQVNRHTAVNIDRLTRVDCDNLELGGVCVTLSRGYRENLLEHLQVLCGR